MDQLDHVLNESIFRVTAPYLTEAQIGDKKAYRAFFEKKLKKYGVESPEDLSDNDKKKFFDEVDKEWNAKHETD